VTIIDVTIHTEDNDNLLVLPGGDVRSSPIDSTNNIRAKLEAAVNILAAAIDRLM
jgi:hypothetical protein